jgi:glycosyltransferase involved in cell wall biosynthesis
MASEAYRRTKVGQLGNLQSVVEQGDVKTRPKRVLHVLFKLTANGPTRDLLDLISHPQETCTVNEVFVFARSDPHFVRAIQDHGVRVSQGDARGFVDCPLKISAAVASIRRFKPDIIQTYDQPVVDWIGRVLAACVGIPQVALALNVVRDYIIGKRGRMAWGFVLAGEMATRRLVTVFVPNASAVQSYLQKVFDTPAERLVLIRTAIDENQFQPQLHVRSASRRRLGVEASEVVFGCIAAVKSAKGQLDLVRAFKRIARCAGVTPKLLLAGNLERPYSDVVLNEIKLGGLSDMCIVNGMVYDVIPVVESLDVFVLPSYVEGFPRALVEAMMMGKPCIVTRVSGCSEAVVDCENGFVVEPGDSEAMAEKMRTLLLDEALRKRMGEASRKRALQHYSMQGRLVAFRDLYSRIAD